MSEIVKAIARFIDRSDAGDITAVLFAAAISLVIVLGVTGALIEQLTK